VSSASPASPGSPSALGFTPVDAVSIVQQSAPPATSHVVHVQQTVVHRVASSSGPFGAWVALGGALLILIGSFGNWMTAMEYSFWGDTRYSWSGIENGGGLTAILAIAGGGFLLYRISGHGPVWSSIVAATALAFAFIRAITSYSDLLDIAAYSALEDASAGWGFFLILLGSLIVTIGMLVHWVRKELPH
jgi:hypothetical protein